MSLRISSYIDQVRREEMGLAMEKKKMDLTKPKIVYYSISDFNHDFYVSNYRYIRWMGRK